MGDVEWWTERFDASMVRKIKTFTQPYEFRGGFGPWLSALLPLCKYRFATAEFGTYSPLRVIAALVDEVRWHGEPDIQPNHPSRRRLLDAFVPRSRSWRTKVLQTGLDLIDRAAHVLWSEAKTSRSLSVVANRQGLRSSKIA